MNTQEALKWADTWGQVPGDDPDGNDRALTALAAEVRRLRGALAAAEDGWKEAAIAWAVCASVHEKWAKGKDALYSTRHADFMKHAAGARMKIAEEQRSHQPKGGMCTSCAKRQQDCSSLPFETMPVILTTTPSGAKVVRCTEHVRSNIEGKGRD